MAHNEFYRNIFTAQSGLNFLTLKWTSSAAGAVPTTLTLSNGIASLVHGATGVYVVTLSQEWAAFLGLLQTTIQASYANTGACMVKVTAETVSATTKTITLLVTNAAGTAVEPTTNDVLSLVFLLQSENVNAGG